MVAIIIPAFNEDPAVLNKTISDWSMADRRVFVIDDGSEPAVSVAPNIVLLRHTKNRGQGAAIRTGLQSALETEADLFLTVDADGQHDPDNFFPLVSPLLNNDVDIVFGSRFLDPKMARELPVVRLRILQMAVRFNNFIIGYRMTDAHNGLRAMNRKAAAALKISEDRMAHASEIPILVREASLRWLEVSVCIRYTQYSLDKGQSIWRVFPLLFQLLQLKNRIG